MVIEGWLIGHEEATAPPRVPTAGSRYSHPVAVEPPPPGEAHGEDPLPALEHWVAEGQVEEAARARARQHWLERQAADGGSLAGVLHDLAEGRATTSVTTSGGRTAVGTVGTVGRDFAVIRDPDKGDSFIPFERVASLRSAPGDSLPIGDRTDPGGQPLTEALRELALFRPEVRVEIVGDQLRGTLAAVGVDLLTLILDGPRRERVHLHLRALERLLVLRS